ncbi:MAG: tRNA (5-methylaminomethyl-2-thiouridine)(34)-methyltransferase MnmD [Rhizobiaceae bacterium]|nr:tRNA (5-methylaminomethyl-2-thiouridine)(34)-methyltransferase MnmD [Rhizobiaceae bacterium]
MLEWRDDKTPVSTRFDDPYYSVDDGRAETEYVFIDGNDLKSRWANMSECMIAELGFGTGLNFLETVRKWRSSVSNGSSLHFISFEQFPITKEEMAKALANWPELQDLASKLTGIWDPAAPVLDDRLAENVRLTVHFGDANTLLPKLDFKADAWYLDGFSPAKNPELWNEKLMREVGIHTVAGGTFATYTSAGFVKRGLQEAGFQVEKVKGFGRKREMLTGKMANDIHVAEEH